VNKTQGVRTGEGSRETHTEESIQWTSVQFPIQWQMPPTPKKRHN